MKHAPQLSDQLGDIQAVLRAGFGSLTRSRFWLLTIARPAQAAAWIDQLRASGLLISAEALGAVGGKPKVQIDEAAAIAFSFAGLRELGIVESEDFPFPTPFRSGMGSEIRKTLLRDTPRDTWQWADVDACAEAACARQVVHVLVAHWWSAAAEGSKKFVPPGEPAFRQPARLVAGCPSYFRDGGMYEPFGFRDGLSQPVIDGMSDESGESRGAAEREAGSVMYRDRQVMPGEFIVGYRNEYRELTYSPDALGWRATDFGGHAGAAFSLNGSYLAVRQIEQHVTAFGERDKPVDAYRACPDGVTVAEKMIGRRRDPIGTPLVLRSRAAPTTAAQADAFRFRVDDANGLLCPRGAHVRRVNPRDSLGVDGESAIRNSKLHRLLRRGRPYRAGVADTKTEGIFFIACNADLERQFEFIHQRWLANPRFSDLDSEDDSTVGAATPGRTFSIPALPVGATVSLEQFSTTRGGGYFFLPGLRALQFIVTSGAARAARATSVPATPAAASTGPSPIARIRLLPDPSATG